MNSAIITLGNRATNLVGHVVGTQMQKTVKVRVPHEIYLPKYRKSIIRHRNYLAHDETGQCLVGDIVKIVKSTRISRLKTHSVAQMIKPADRFVDPDTNYVFTNGHLNIPVGRRDPETGQIRNLISQQEYKQMGLL